MMDALPKTSREPQPLFCHFAWRDAMHELFFVPATRGAMLAPTYLASTAGLARRLGYTTWASKAVRCACMSLPGAAEADPCVPHILQSALTSKVVEILMKRLKC